MGSIPSEGVKADKGLSSRKQESEGPQKESKDSLARPQAQRAPAQNRARQGTLQGRRLQGESQT